jgi:hypothetical protein
MATGRTSPAQHRPLSFAPSFLAGAKREDFWLTDPQLSLAARQSESVARSDLLNFKRDGSGLRGRPEKDIGTAIPSSESLAP